MARGLGKNLGERAALKLDDSLAKGTTSAAVAESRNDRGLYAERLYSQGPGTSFGTIKRTRGQRRERHEPKRMTS